MGFADAHASLTPEYRSFLDKQREIERAKAARDAAAQQPEQKKKKDFLTDQISTGGGIGGALAGGAAGASLGSIVPGIGTVIGGLAGAILGGATGSGGGELAENFITGEEDKLKNVGQEAILGGIFSAPPVRAAKGIIGALKGVGSGAAKEGFEQGFTKAGLLSRITGNAAETAGVPLKTSAQGRLQDLGNKALLSQYGTIGKPVARSTNPTETIGQLADYGITNPQDAERIASAVTGSGGILNKAVARSVDKAGGVDTTNLRRIAEDALQLNGVVEKDAKSVMSVVDAQLRRLQGGPAGSLNPLADPNDALDVMRTLERRIADLNGKGGNARLATGERSDQAKALQAIHDEIEDRLYRGAGADKNLSNVLTPEVREQLVSLKPNDKNWQAFVDSRVMNAKGIEDLRSAQAPFVRVGRIIDDADQNSLTFGGRSGNLASNLSAGGITGALASTATNLAQPVLARYGGQALRKGAGQASNGAMVASKPKLNSPLGVVGRLGIAAPLLSNDMDSVQGESGLRGQSPVSASLSDALVEAASDTPEEAGISPYPKANLMADIQRDPRNAEKYIAQYEALQEIYAPPVKEKTSATAQKALAQSANGESTISQLSELLNAAGGGQGNVGGNISSFLGGLGLNDNAKTYNDLARGSVAQIAKALGETGALSDSDITTYSAMLPKLTDTEAVARNKLVALKQRLAAARQSTMRYGASDLTDAILTAE